MLFMKAPESLFRLLRFALAQISRYYKDVSTISTTIQHTECSKKENIKVVLPNADARYAVLCISTCTSGP